MTLVVNARKQSISHEQFVQIRDHATRLVPRPKYEHLLERTLVEIRQLTAGRRVGFCWSGGKDSQALEVVMKLAGIDDCCFGMSDLEYHQFLEWVTNHMPFGLQIFNNGWDVGWLARHEALLFPQTAAQAGRWFSGIQHRAQRIFAANEKLEMLITGRRKADGNYVAGEQGTYRGRDGVLRYAPLRDWSHADVFACLAYAGIAEQPPFYSWPRGYRCGTHAWPARQWCPSTQQAFAEVYAIEPDRIREAAAGGVASAAAWLRLTGRS